MFLSALDAIPASAVAGIAIINTLLLIFVLLFLEFTDSDEVETRKSTRQLLVPVLFCFGILVLSAVVQQVLPK